MVLESIISPLKAEKSPYKMFFIGFVFATIGIFLSIWIFRQYSSLVMVFLTVMACTPFMYSTMKREEEKDLKIVKESVLLKEHGKALSYLIFMFVGITAAYTFWYLAFPSSVVSDLFSVQTQTILHVNNQLTGDAIGSFGLASKIFLNNMRVMVFCVLFSFVYGVGAIFILVWNASVIGAAMGNFIRTRLVEYASYVGLAKLGAYFHVSALSILRYALHGIPEILAYFTAGLAGGIISIAIARHDFGTKKFEKIALDSTDLLLLSVFILFIAAIIEVYIVPALF